MKKRLTPSHPKQGVSERYYVKGEDLFFKDSSKHVLVSKIQTFKEGGKTEYTSRDMDEKHTRRRYDLRLP